MKLTAVVVLFATSLGITDTASASPLAFEWSRNLGRHIVVLDEMAPLVADVETWRGERDEVLSAYTAAGFTFDVQEVTSDLDCGTEFGPKGTVRICKGDGLWAGWRFGRAGRIKAAWAELEEPHQGALCHEFGHTLGLGHAEGAETQTTCMYDWWRVFMPNENDIATLRATG